MKQGQRANRQAERWPQLESRIPMSERSSHFAICRTDDGWFVRFVATNNRIVWVTPGIYSRRTAAVAAVHAIARAMSPSARIWISSSQLGGRPSGSEVRFGHPDDTYATAHVVEVRDVDLRSVA